MFGLNMAGGWEGRCLTPKNSLATCPGNKYYHNNESEIIKN